MWVDVLSVAAAVAVCFGMLWLAGRIEPHWLSKDRTRIITTAEIVDRFGRTVDKRREVRVSIAADGTLLVSRRRLWRTVSDRFRVAGRSPAPPRRKEVFLLQPVLPDPEGLSVLLRIPSGSAAVGLLDGLVARPDGDDAPRPFSPPGSG